MRNRVVLALAFLFFLVPESGILLALPPPERDPNEDPNGTTGALKEQIQTGGSYSAHSGNATRVVTDLSVPDALGENGLNFTRYWNSVHNDYEDEDADWSMDFGHSGWSHSWKWTAIYKGETIEPENGPGERVHNMAITITFPDGHTTKYKIVRSSYPQGSHSPDNRLGPYYTNEEITTSWPEGGMGVHDHLTKMDVWGADFWLSLADGGAVHFVRITAQNANDGEYRATEVFDRHGLKTVLEYNNETGELERVRQDDGGRFLKITWSTINHLGNWRVITKVETGGTGLQQVIYNYTLSGAHVVLANVAYENDPVPGQTAYAVYTYGNCYGDGLDGCIGTAASDFPLLKRADDPRYAGAMTKIHYTYRGAGCTLPEPTPPWQPPLYVPAQPYAIEAEKSHTGVAVSRFQLYCETGERIETNGFGATRMFYLGSTAGTAGPLGSNILCRGFQLGKVTDFYRGSPPANLPNQRQNFFFGHPRQIWDGRDNETQSFYLDSSGSPSEVHYIEDGSSVIYNRLDDSLSETPLHPSMHNSNKRWLFWKRDELGRTTVYKRDSRRRVKEIAYPDNWHEFYTYNSFNQVETHKLPSEAVQHYHYNALQQLDLEYNDANEVRNEYYYDGLGRVERMRDARAIADGAEHTVKMEYNGRHKVTKVYYRAIAGGSTPTVTYEYDKYGNCTAITNELGHRSTYTYDAYRRCTSYTEPINAPGWDGTGTISARRWDWIYDRWVDNVLYPASSHTSKEWRVQVEPAFNGAGLRRMTAREHDVNNRIVLEQTGWIQPPGKIGAGGSSWYPGPDIETHRTTYDENGQKSSFTDTFDRVTDYFYDERNRLKKTIEKPIPGDPSAPRTTETRWDPAGNKLWVKFPDNQTQHWQNYDAFGQPGLFISERNHPTDLIYCWGPMKKLYQVITHRDGEGGQLTEFGYDPMGRPTKITFPDGSYEKTTYRLGQIDTWMNRRGGTKVIDEYDARGRETHHFWQKPNSTAIDLQTPGITREWDAANRLTSIENVFSAIEYQYDDAGQMKSERSTVSGAQGYAQINYCRYANGEVSLMTYPNQTRVDRFYTERGQLLSVGWGGGMSTAFDYRSDGKVNYQARTNGVGTNYGYDGRGMIEWLNHRRGATQTAGEHDLARRDYWRDDRDRILAWKRGTDNYYNGMEDGRGTRYGYDPEGQLTTASYRMPNPEATPSASPNGAMRMDSFNYDEMGNRKDQNHVASRAQWMTMERRNNGLNQYSFWENEPGSSHWESDIFHDDEFGSPPAPPGNGDVTKDGYLTANYNGLNQPVSMWRNGYAQNYFMWFGYDPLGRCVKRWNGPSAVGTPGYQFATYFYYDGWNLVQEGSSAGSVDRTYVHGGRIDEIVASQVNGYWYNHHYDAQGNCIMLSTANGDISEQFDYDAFGWPYFYTASGFKLGMANLHTRFLFTGREWIMDMRLYDYRHRMYQPELGRFLQPDPKHFGGGDYNLYRYCHNDPVNKLDPLGLLELSFADTYPASDQARVRAAFNLGAGTERGTALNADKRTVFVHPADSNNPTGRVGNNIFLDPSDRIFLDKESRKLYEQKYRNELPPQDARGRAIILWHEIGHIVTDERDEKYGGRNVHKNENPIRRQLNPTVGYRLQYAGHPITGNPEDPPWTKELGSNLVRQRD